MLETNLFIIIACLSFLTVLAGVVVLVEMYSDRKKKAEQ